MTPVRLSQTPEFKAFIRALARQAASEDYEAMKRDAEKEKAA